MQKIASVKFQNNLLHLRPRREPGRRDPYRRDRRKPRLPLPVTETRIVYAHYAGEGKSGVCSIRSCNIDGTGSATLETLGEYAVDHLTANAGGTMIGYYKQDDPFSAGSYAVRQLGASSLGATVSTTSGSVRFRFGRIKKELFDAAPAY